MTDLIPNLADLLAALPASAAGRDATELVAAARVASTWAEVDAALDQVVSRWASPFTTAGSTGAPACGAATV